MPSLSSSRAAALAALLLALTSLVALAWQQGEHAGRGENGAALNMAAPLQTEAATPTVTLTAATAAATRTPTPTGPATTATRTPTRASSLCPERAPGTATPDAQRCKFYYPVILDGFPILEPTLTVQVDASNTTRLAWSLSADDQSYFTPATPIPNRGGSDSLQWIVRRSTQVVVSGGALRLLDPEDVCVTQQTSYQIGSACAGGSSSASPTPTRSSGTSSVIYYYQVVAVTAWRSYPSNIVTSYNVSAPLVWSEYRDGSWDIWKFDGQDPVNLTADWGTSDEIEPLVSPDGRFIAFASNRLVGTPDPGGTNRANYEIYVMGVDGSNRRPWTQTTGYTSVHPFWSPNGQQLAFTSDAGTFNTLDIFTLDAFPSAPLLVSTGDTPGVRRLTWPDPPATVPPTPSVPAPTPSPTTTPKTDPTSTPTATISPYDNFFRQSTSREASWSPDGTRIAFVSNRALGNQGCGQEEVYVMRSDGRAQQRVTCSRGQNLWPRWSPDGQRLVFISNRDGNWEVYTIRLDGSDERRLTNNQTTDTQPSWAPTGREIVYVGECFDLNTQSLRRGLCLLPLDRSEAPKLILPTQGDVYAPSWSG